MLYESYDFVISVDIRRPREDVCLRMLVGKVSEEYIPCFLIIIMSIPANLTPCLYLAIGSVI